MPRIKKLNLILHYGETPYHVNDLGEAKNPRFELYNTETKTTERKSNNPLDFHEYMDEIYQKMEGGNSVQESVKTKAKRTRKTTKQA